MMYKSYKVVDVKSLLNDSRKFATEKKELERELDNLLGLSAINNDVCVQTSNISDLTGSTATKRDAVQEKINWISHHENALSLALSRLSQEEQDVIQCFYFGRGYMNVRIDTFSYEHGLSKTGVYNLHGTAIRRLQDILNDLI